MVQEEDRKLLREVGKQGEGQSEEVQTLIDEVSHLCGRTAVCDMTQHINLFVYFLT